MSVAVCRHCAFLKDVSRLHTKVSGNPSLLRTRGAFQKQIRGCVADLTRTRSTKFGSVPQDWLQVAERFVFKISLLA